MMFILSALILCSFLFGTYNPHRIPVSTSADLIASIRDLSGNIAAFYIVVAIIWVVLVGCMVWQNRARHLESTLVPYPFLLVSISLVLTTLLVPVQADVFAKQGWGYEQINDWNSAYVCRTEALRMNPLERKYTQAVIYLLMTRGRTDRNDGVLRRARDMASGLWDGYHHVAYSDAWDLARISAMLGDVKLATIYYNEAIALYPNNRDLVSERDQWLINVQKFSKP